MLIRKAAVMFTFMANIKLVIENIMNFQLICTVSLFQLMGVGLFGLIGQPAQLLVVSRVSGSGEGRVRPHIRYIMVISVGARIKGLRAVTCPSAEYVL